MRWRMCRGVYIEPFTGPKWPQISGPKFDFEEPGGFCHVSVGDTPR